VIGNNRDLADASLDLAGARDVRYVNNTVVGNLRSDAFAMNADRKGLNPRNRDLVFANNIWADPTGTMGNLSNGKRTDTVGLTLRRNLYWNGGRRVPGGDLVGPRADPLALWGNPRLNHDQRHVVLPRWAGTSFRSGNRTIGQEFLRLVRRYGAIASSSAAVDRALATYAPARDILGRPRGSAPDLGAFEVP
jgi:hypothetical protein